MNKRVHAIIGIVSIMSNWNADFSKYPKTTSNGQIFGSDKALKHPMRKMWEDNGEKVLYIKSREFLKVKGKEATLNIRSLKERYEYIFSADHKNDLKDNKEVLKNLFSAIDVKQFGATFPVKDANISFAGAVQIAQGFNKYEFTSIEEQTILSPFRNDSKDTSEDNLGDNSEDSSKKDKNSTLGNQIITDEAHYFYSVKINPLNYKEYIELGVTDGYTLKDYEKFKEAALVSATYLDTNAKVGCENEFALFIETEPDLYLPSLDKYIKFTKGQEKNTIEITCHDLINSFKDKGKIKNIEIYYNVDTTDVKFNVEGVKSYNIFTREEV